MTWSQFLGGIDDTPPRDFKGEMGDITKQSGDWLDMAQAGDVKAAHNQIGTMEDFFNQALNRYPELARNEREATSTQRAQDTTDIGHSGKRLQGIIEGMAPELKTAGTAISRMLQGVGQNTPLLNDLNTSARGAGMSPINTRLQDMASRELDLGGSLSPDEARKVQQDARAGYSARGTLGGDASTIDEVMNLAGARQARLRERMGMADTINKDWLSELAQNRGFQTDVEGLNQRKTAMDEAFIPAAVGAGNARLAPMLNVMGQRTNVNPLGAGQMFGMAPNAIGSSNQSLGQVMGYGQDLFNTNFNADWSKQVMETNNAVALHKSMDEAISTMVGGAMGGCWVARTVFGPSNPKWLHMRRWLHTAAPVWFRAFYLTRGPKWAARIAKPEAAAERADIRAVFDAILSSAN